MAQSQNSPLVTPLADRHVALGARIVEFAGWLMPLQYAGILEEHRAVRSRAGVFDLSHMGELFVEGPEAANALSYALTTDPANLKVGRAHYSMICFPEGGVLDDLIVYRLGDERFMVVANASNAVAVSDALAARLARFRVVLDDRSLATALVAVQGPRSAGILAPLTDVALDGLRYYAIAEGHVAGIPALVARTGYTGEDGFEVFTDVGAAVTVWDAVLDAGKAVGAVPAGLGARDTLRLEAGMPLYGNELGRDTTPFDAGLSRVVGLAKEGDFVGRAALEKARAEGPRKMLVGLVVRGRGIARHGYELFAGDRKIGVVTSGTQSPTLGVPIAMAYVTPSEAGPGTIIDVDIRDQRVPAEIVPLPFYKRPV
ncbi:MAG: glycine cleavage system aminomethyltransferase GcvT [Candidatus Limnocylindrales bacterium]|jgi:aminomethyltransferase